MTPRFSIAIPVHNRADYLRCALRSALEQTLKCTEIIVSDDCSDEDLRKVIDEYPYGGIRYVRSGRRLGASGNHQRATNLAQGEFVVLLHSDDALLPEFCEKAWQRFQERPDAGAVFMRMVKAVGLCLTDITGMPKIDFADRSALALEPGLVKFAGAAPSCCAFRRSVFERLGGYRTDLRFAYDWELYMRMLTRGGGVCFERSIQTIYRLHNEQSNELDGLRDLLILHRQGLHPSTPVETADLILHNFSSVLRNKVSLESLHRVINHAGSYRDLATGLCGALGLRVKRRWRRHFGPKAAVASSPEHRAEIAVAQKLWERWNSPPRNVVSTGE